MRLIVFVVASVFPSRRDMTRVLLDTHIHRENKEYIYIENIYKERERGRHLKGLYIGLLIIFARILWTFISYILIFLKCDTPASPG